MDFNRAPSDRELRWFGVLIALFFCLIGTLVYWRLGAERVAIGLGAFGLFIALVYYSVPTLRRPVYMAWMTAVSPLGWLISRVLLAATFFLIVTPAALVMRIFGRDKLDRRLDKSAASYWVEREATPEASRYFRQS